MLGLPACLLLSVAAAPREWTVMCLGDSITACSGPFGCYRNELAARLAGNGYKVRFVGSQESESPVGPLRHEGYGGRTTEYLAANIERWYKENPADIVLLHSGHNHFAEEHPVAGILSATERIVTTVRHINPRVIVLLARVIPSRKLPKYAYLAELNAALPELAKRLSTPCQPVIVVDQSAGFDPMADTVADGVHPNASGAKKIAARWYDALVPILKQARPDAACGGRAAFGSAEMQWGAANP